MKYRSGNLASVANALKRLGAGYLVTDEAERLEHCDAVIFPGVGHAAPAMEDLRNLGLDQWLKMTDKPVLGICLGMQLLFESTPEGDCRTLGLLPGRLEKFKPNSIKVPHMGWNHLEQIKNHPLLNGLGEEDFFYFVHSYFAPVTEYTLAAGRYGDLFSAVVAKKNLMGVQFHPEKSSRSGRRLLSNFLDLAGSSEGN